MKKFQKGLKRQWLQGSERKFSNKKKRTYYNCGSTKHFITKCPYEIKDNKYKRDKKEDKADQRKSKKWRFLKLLLHQFPLMYLMLNSSRPLLQPLHTAVLHLRAAVPCL